MEVILTVDVPKLGKAGDVVRVSDGYARNYLFPRNLAVEATDSNLKKLESERKTLEKREERKKLEAMEIARKIENMTISIAAQVGEGGRLFGSITASDIQHALKGKGMEIDRKRIIIEEPIRATGEYIIRIKLGKSVSCNLILNVVDAKSELKDGFKKEEE